jgi:hypothetical protein
MGNQTVTLDDLKGRPLEEVLQTVADQQAALVVRLRDGKEGGQGARELEGCRLCPRLKVLTRLRVS